jgi:hypothetical protein
MADAAAQVQTIDPLLSEPGARCLLLSGGAAHRLERATDHTLHWTFFDEKLVLGGSRTAEGYIGRLVFGARAGYPKGRWSGSKLPSFAGRARHVTSDGGRAPGVRVGTPL